MTWNTSKPNLEVSVSSLNLNVDDLEAYTSGAEIFGGETVSELRLIETDTTAMTADLNELTAAPVAKLLTVVTRAITTSGTSLALTAAETFARKAYLNARRANAANSGYVYVGNSDVDYSTNQQMALAPGDAIVIDDGPGTKFDLNKVYLDATKNNDGITGFYFPV